MVTAEEERVLRGGLLIEIWRYLVLLARYSELFIENREIFISHLYLAPRR